MKFDFWQIMDIIGEYVEGEIDGRNPEILRYVEYFYQEVQEELLRDRDYFKTVKNTLDSFQLAGDSEAQEARARALSKIKKIDAAWISANFGFMFGMVYAENLRLHFYEDKVKLEDCE